MAIDSAYKTIQHAATFMAITHEGSTMAQSKAGLVDRRREQLGLKRTLNMNKTSACRVDERLKYNPYNS